MVRHRARVAHRDQEPVTPRVGDSSSGSANGNAVPDRRRFGHAARRGESADHPRPDDRKGNVHREIRLLECEGQIEKGHSIRLSGDNQRCPWSSQYDFTICHFQALSLGDGKPAHVDVVEQRMIGNHRRYRLGNPSRRPDSGNSVGNVDGDERDRLVGGDRGADEDLEVDLLGRCDVGFYIRDRGEELVHEESRFAVYAGFEAPQHGCAHITLVVVCQQVLAVEEGCDACSRWELVRLLENLSTRDGDGFGQNCHAIDIETKRLCRVRASGGFDRDSRLHAPGSGCDREIGYCSIGVRCSNRHETCPRRGKALLDFVQVTIGDENEPGRALGGQQGLREAEGRLEVGATPGRCDRVGGPFEGVYVIVLLNQDGRLVGSDDQAGDSAVGDLVTQRLDLFAGVCETIGLTVDRRHRPGSIDNEHCVLREFGRFQPGRPSERECEQQHDQELEYQKQAPAKPLPGLGSSYRVPQTIPVEERGDSGRRPPRGEHVEDDDGSSQGNGEQPCREQESHRRTPAARQVLKRSVSTSSSASTTE